MTLASSLVLHVPSYPMRRHTLRQRFSVIASRRALVITTLIIACLVGNLLLTRIRGIPRPVIHDEFAYLLASDTFAHGRLTNPSPPMPEHFETFHTLVRPTYMAKYPPAQGLFLALGQILTGYPIAGVWLGLAFMIAAIAYMLYAFVPPRWALLGSVFALVSLSFFTYWSTSYWGGAVHAGAAALLFGALKRLTTSLRPRHAILLGLALAILANSRPLEGLLLSLPPLTFLGYWLMNSSAFTFRQKIMRAVLPFSVVLLVTALWMAYYNFRITGNPLVLPYSLYCQQYEISPVTLLGSPRMVPPAYQHELLRTFFTAMNEHRIKDFTTFYAHTQLTATFFLDFFSETFALPRVLLCLLPVFLLPLMRLPWLRLLAASAIFVMAAHFLSNYYWPHYSAGLTPLLILMLIQLARWLRTIKIRQHAAGRPLTILLIALAVVSLSATAYQKIHAASRSTVGSIGSETGIHMEDRFTFVETIRRAYGGKHLFIVKQIASQDAWSFNPADMASADCIFARDITPESNRELQSHFPERTIWFVTPSPISLTKLRDPIPHSDIAFLPINSLGPFLPSSPPVTIASELPKAK